MFTRLTDSIYVAGQISTDDVAAAKALGISYILNNRPDGEEPTAPQSVDIEAAAREAGIGYAAVPVSHGGFAPWQLDGMADAMEKAAGGKLLAYCRSGTRSTLLWALTMARAGVDGEEIAEIAAQAGYDVSPVRQIMDALSVEHNPHPTR